MARTVASLGLQPGQNPQLDQLAAVMHSDAGISKACNTVAVYKPHWQRWEAFCGAHGFDPCCGSSSLVALFLTQQRIAAGVRSVGPQAVTQAASAVSAYHTLRALPSPCDAPAVRTVCEVARRSLSATPLHREAIGPAEIKSLVRTHITAACGLETRMLVTCMVLAYAAQLRYDDLQHVMVHYDLLRLRDDHAQIYLWRSKTDPHARGEWVHVSAVSGPCCPLRLLRDLLAAGGYKRVPGTAVVRGAAQEVEDVGPLLRDVTARGGQQALAQVTAPLASGVPAMPYSAFRTKMQDLLRRAGIHAALGTHSFRIGATTAAVQAGADPVLVQKAGRWRSALVFQRTYVRDSIARKLSVSQAMGLAG